MRLRGQVEEYIRECRRSVWNLRSPALETHDLADALRTAAGSMTAAARIALDVTVDGTPERYPSRVEQHLLRIGQEAVANSVRHARARTVRVHLGYAGDQLSLRVRDDGIGFEPLAAPGTGVQQCGLAGMKERAAAIGASLTIRSEGGTGTEVVVSVPKTKDGTSRHGTEHPHALRG